MGEVYRADDLTLDQPVALKFLPLELDRDTDRRERFSTRSRSPGRSPTPMSVGSTTSVGSTGARDLPVDGVHRRRGPVDAVAPDRSAPGRQGDRDRAADLRRARRRPRSGHRPPRSQARQRDDRRPGAGRGSPISAWPVWPTIRGAEIRAGTPAYMAPEQLAGEEVTVQSDIYSLGLCSTSCSPASRRSRPKRSPS